MAQAFNQMFPVVVMHPEVNQHKVRPIGLQTAEGFLRAVD
jgi:hypothetical protein